MAASFLIAAALMAQAAVVAPAEAGGAQTDSSTITASARTYRNYGWLTTAGPDAQGQYVAWVKVSDLDFTTEAGQSAMASRMRKAGNILCGMSGEQPQVPGFYNPGERACWRDSEQQAAAQLSKARDAAAAGRPVALLGLSTSSAR